MADSKISIIVPVYNVERFLRKCIDCILAQTFIDFELLLINDGSKDNSGAICDEYGAKDSRIRVFHKKNGGVSSARNLGLDNAKGEWVIFMDADDFWCDNTILEQLYSNAIEYNIDIVRGEYKAVDSEGNLLFERPIPSKKMEFANTVLSPSRFYKDIISGENFLVLSLVRLAVIGNLRFDTNRVFLEDMEFYAKLLLNPLRCMYLPLRFYAYRKIQESASNTPKIKNLEDSFSMCRVFDNLCKRTQDIVLSNAFRYNSIMMYYWTLCTLASKPYVMEYQKIIHELNLIDLQRDVKIWTKNDGQNTYPIAIKFSPLITIPFLKYIIQVKDFIYSLKQKNKH